MSVVDTKELAYDTLKTLSSTNDEDRNDDYSSFGNDDDDYEVYAPESFSKFFGDFIPDEEIQEAINRLREEKAAVESDKSDESDSDESIGSNDSDAETEPTVDKNADDNKGLLGRFLKKFVRLA